MRQKVIEYRYGQNLNYWEIAARLDIGYDNIRKICRIYIEQNRYCRIRRTPKEVKEQKADDLHADQEDSLSENQQHDDDEPMVTIVINGGESDQSSDSSMSQEFSDHTICDKLYAKNEERKELHKFLFYEDKNFSKVYVEKRGITSDDDRELE